MLAEFILDVLTLRQGRRVDEVPADMHYLKGGARLVQDWYAFLVEQGEVRLDRDAVRQAVLWQEELVDRMRPGLDEDNLRLARQHKQYLWALRENLDAVCDDEGEDDPPLLSLAFAMDCACYTRQHAFDRDVFAVGQGMSAGRRLSEFFVRSDRSLRSLVH